MKQICSIKSSSLNSSQSERTCLISFNPKSPDPELELESLIQNLTNEGFIVSSYSANTLSNIKTKNVSIQFKIGNDIVLDINLFPPKHRYLKKVNGCYEFKLDAIRKCLEKSKKYIEKRTKDETIAKFRWPLLLAFIENEMTERGIKFERTCPLTPYSSNSQFFSWIIKNFQVSINLENSLLTTLKFEKVKCNIDYMGSYYINIPLLNFLNKQNVRTLKKEMDKIYKETNSELEKLHEQQLELNKQFSEFHKHINKLEQQKIKEIYGK